MFSSVIPRTPDEFDTEKSPDTLLNYAKQRAVGAHFASLLFVIASQAKQSPSKGYDGAVKIGATQIKLDIRMLGDEWTEILEEILSSNCA